MEEQNFALMLRHALTEYDFERIDVTTEKASVILTREVYAENGKGVVLEFNFSNQTIIQILSNLKSYLPTL